MKHHSRQTARIIAYELTMTDETLGVEVYASTTGHSVMAFSGKRNKPDFHLRFGSTKEADGYVISWHDRLRHAAKVKAERRAARKNYTTSLEVGDVLRSSWGYEQTNIEYYEVVKVIGGQTVELRELEQVRENTSDMTGKTMPLPGQYCSPAIRRRVDPSGTVKISSFQYARKKEMHQAGPVKIHTAEIWTAYG